MRFFHWVGWKLEWLLWNNNGWLLIFWLITLGLFIKAVSGGFGPPIVSTAIEEIVETKKEKSGHRKKIDELWRGPQAPAPPPTPIPSTPPTQKTWKWWISFFISFFISLAYTPIAFREEVKEVWQNAWARLKEKENAEAKEHEGIEASASASAKTTGGSSFAKELSVEFAAEWAMDALKKIGNIFRRK